ncbi:HD-GYP domain-containing protein [Paenibacillaceae bacterium]|nr:HD-GYP domain-containing protein [Paenibacillaceae bacterium]
MRLVPVQQCQPGMKLAKKIYSEDGIVLLGRHVELTRHLIRRLGECGIGYVYIEDEMTSDVTAPEMLSEDLHIRALKEVRTGFRKLIDSPKRSKGGTYPYIARQFKDVMSLVVDELSGRDNAMIMLMNMGAVDHYLFQHSLNVCVYSVMLGIADGYSREDLSMLGMGALLHDIGKTQIPETILFKPSALTKDEYEEMKRHAELGFQLLKDEPNVSLTVAHCAYQHHERIDGSGYPRGIHDKEIHPYAKWIGLVDSYDAMTTTRIYSSPLLPHQAMEGLYVGSGTLYEQRMVRLFRDKVFLYPIGVSVKLNSGESGIVVGADPTCLHRPIVRVLYNEAGERLKAPYETDLSEQLTTMIVSVNDSDIHIPATSDEDLRV